MKTVTTILSLLTTWAISSGLFAQVPPLALPEAQPIKASSPVQQAAAVSPETAPVWNTEANNHFITKVQPVLVNMCSTCHLRDEHVNGFKMKNSSAQFIDAESARHNMRSAAKYLDAKTPEASPIIHYTLTAHGGAKQPPMHSKKHPAYQHLQLWVHWASQPNGSAEPRVLPSSVVASKPNPSLLVPVAGTDTFAVPVTMPNRPGSAAPGLLPQLPEATPLPAKEKNGFATANREPEPISPMTRNPSDPFDPAKFNQYAHPERK